MKQIDVTRLVVIVGGLLLAGGTILPLWTKNGVDITGWEGHYLSLGRWVLLIAGVTAIVFTLVPILRKPIWVMACEGLGMMQASLIIWKGYKMHAVGYGAWILLAGAVLVIGAGLLLQRSQHKEIQTAPNRHP